MSKITTIDPGGNTKSIDYGQFGGFENWLKLTSNATPSRYAALRQLVAWTQKGVIMTSVETAQLPYVIIDNVTGEEIEPERAWGAIKDPQRYFQLIAASLCSGAGYIRYKAIKGAPIKFQYVLATTIIKINYDDTGVPVSFERQAGSGKREVIPAEEMLYFWLPDDTIETGPAQVTPLSNAMIPSSMIAAMDSTLTEYGERGFIPPMFAVAEGVQPSERERVENKLSEFMRGLWKLRVMLVNGQKLIPQPVGVSMEGLRGSYIQIYRQQIENIAASFGIPSTLFLSNEQNRATAETNRKAWYTSSIFVSIYQCIQDTFTDQLFSRWNWSMEFRPQDLDAFKQSVTDGASAVSSLASTIAANPESALIAMGIIGIDLTDEQREEIEELAAPEPEPEPAAPEMPAMEEPPAVDEELDAEDEAMAAALRKWERFEVANFGKGKQFDAGRAGVQIPERLAYSVRAELAAIKSADEIPAVFVRAAKDVPALLLAKELRKLAK